jgi:L-fuculose-phosphate aldolase
LIQDFLGLSLHTSVRQGLSRNKRLTRKALASTLPQAMGSPFTMRKTIADIGRRLAERGMVAGTEGNISVRLDDDRIMVTPSGLPKGRLEPDDMVIVDENGKKLQGRCEATSELPMHLFVYRSRPEIAACVHSHPPYATAFGVAGITLADNILPEIVVGVGGIPLTDYAPPGTESVPKSLEPFIETSSAFLLRNHGLLTIGRDVEEAYLRHETVEHYAHIVFLAMQLGSINSIPTEDFQRLEKMRRKLDQAWQRDR